MNYDKFLERIKMKICETLLEQGSISHCCNKRIEIRLSKSNSLLHFSPIAYNWNDRLIQQVVGGIEHIGDRQNPSWRLGLENLTPTVHQIYRYNCV